MSQWNSAVDMGVTDNARLLLGYIAGSLSIEDDPTYRLVEANPVQGTQVLEHPVTKNLYRVSVVQLTGTI